MTPVRILGIGSPNGDDQIGWLAVTALEQSGVLELFTAGWISQTALDRPELNLIPHLAEAEWVILVDALCGDGSPGSIRRMDGAGLASALRGLSTHGFAVESALALARELGCLPRRLTVYGIEIAQAAPGAPVSLPVRNALPELVKAIAVDLERAQPR